MRRHHWAEQGCTRGRTRVLVGVAVCVLLLLLTSCTTVTQIGVDSSAVGGSNRAPSGQTVPANSPSGSSTTSTTPASASASGPSVGSAGGVVSAARTDTPAATGTATASDAAKCATPVKIGVSYSSDLAGGFSSVGGSSSGASSAGSYEAQEQAVFNALAANLNKHGGLAGCPVEVVYHDFLSLAADGFSGESESECVDFAEDQHVFAVISTALENKTLVACLAQHGVVSLFDSEEYAPTSQDFTTYRGYLYEPDYINIDRWGPYIQLLAQSGFLGSGAKVGILAGDDGSGNVDDLVNNVWVPELKAMGITPVVFTYTDIEGYSDVTDTTDEFNSAVLQFKQAGVNRVIATPDGGDSTVFFTQLAASQDFDPEYAENDLSAMDEWSTVPASQQPGAVAVSYNITNSASSTGQVPPATPVRQSCDAVLNGLTGSNGDYPYYSFCDDFDFLGAALAGATSVTPSTLLAGAEKLGCSLQLAGLYTNACFGPGKYDGGTDVQLLQWSVSSQNWLPVGNPTPIP
jgi:ABC-type branched-subunit amino acid transport system substrate-binding protein